MPIDFPCACGERLQVDNQFAGTQFKCPSCGRLVTVPLSPGQPHPANGDAQLFRKVSVAALWTGILGCTGPILVFIMSMFVLPLLGERWHLEEPSARLILVLFLLFFFAVAGLAASITGIVTGAIGLNRANTRYRGYAKAGLVTGIIGLIPACILACAALFD